MEKVFETNLNLGNFFARIPQNIELLGNHIFRVALELRENIIRALNVPNTPITPITIMRITTLAIAKL